MGRAKKIEPDYNRKSFSKSLEYKFHGMETLGNSQVYLYTMTSVYLPKRNRQSYYMLYEARQLFFCWKVVKMLGHSS